MELSKARPYAASAKNPSVGGMYVPLLLVGLCTGLEQREPREGVRNGNPWRIEAEVALSVSTPTGVAFVSCSTSWAAVDDRLESLVGQQVALWVSAKAGFRKDTPVVYDLLNLPYDVAATAPRKSYLRPSGSGGGARQ